MSDSIHIFERYVDGDSLAADELFYRYVERLTKLARSRLSASLARRVDADDIVMSAYRSFFVGTRDGEFVIERSGELWSLLVRITLNKLYRTVDHHAAKKRSVQREVAAPHELAQTQPSHEDAVELADQLEVIMRDLTEDRRRILELRLQGELINDIACELNINERTVRRALDAIRERLVKSAGLAPGWNEDVPTRTPFVADENKLEANLAYSNFVLEQQVAVGGMGRVYRATRKNDGAVVAIKYLRKGFVERSGSIQRFAEEATTVAGFDHPNIVKVHGFGRTPAGSIFIAMDFVQGENLAQIVGRQAISVRQAVDWLVPICDALRHAHEQQIIHCDLKPANILIREDTVPLLTDFGLANRVGEGHPLREGTAPFMAPEQIDDHFGPIDESTDVYGMAAVLFNLLAGQPPYSGSRPEDIFAQIVSAVHPPRLSGPSHLVRLCEESMGPRASRPETVVDFAQRLRVV